ncbi:MAG: riboflavin biosynthesis protein RibF [Bacilli bacterium]
MELIRFEFNKKYALPPLAVALGHFDGLHLAHRELIGRAVAAAKETGAKSAVITFDPHPDYVLKKRPPAGYLTPLPLKRELLASWGIDYLIVVPFSKELAELEPEEFENAVLASFDIKQIVVGFDYRYGRGGQGDGDRLKNKYPVIVVPAVTYQGEKIGSAFIRRMLTTGDMTAVRAMFGRYYEIRGKVAFGRGRGRLYGVPTANVVVSEDYHAVKKGVYAVFVTARGARRFGVADYGVMPTFALDEKPRLEVHIVGFSESLYGEEITVEFARYLREEKRFSDEKDLIKQIRRDIEAAQKIREEL